MTNFIFRNKTSKESNGNEFWLVCGRFLVQISVAKPIILRFYHGSSRRILGQYIKLGYSHFFLFTIHYPAINLPSDAVHSELLRASLNQPHRKEWISHYTMKVFREVEVNIHGILTSALGKCEMSISHSARSGEIAGPELNAMPWRRMGE
jgi:hypothetical protein